MTFEVGVYRTVIHHRTLIVDAECADEAYEHASQVIDASCAEDIDVGWKHNRTELGVRFVKPCEPEE